MAKLFVNLYAQRQKKSITGSVMDFDRTYGIAVILQLFILLLCFRPALLPVMPKSSSLLTLADSERLQSHALPLFPNLCYMGRQNIPVIVIAAIILAALVVFLIWKNRKDKKLLNPDAEDAVEETRMDQERKADKM